MIHLRENWYRDVWLFAVTALMLAAILTARSENRARIGDIQRSRVYAVRVSCEEQNRRHDKTIATLDRVLAIAERRAPAQRAQLRERRASTVLLIDALAPKQDCLARVKRFTGAVH